MKRFALALLLSPLLVAFGRGQTVTLTATVTTFAGGTTYITNTCTGNQSPIVQIAANGTLSLAAATNCPHTVTIVPSAGSTTRPFPVALPVLTANTDISSYITAQTPAAPPSPGGTCATTPGNFVCSNASNIVNASNFTLRSAADTATLVIDGASNPLLVYRNAGTSAWGLIGPPSFWAVNDAVSGSYPLVVRSGSSATLLDVTSSGLVIGGTTLTLTNLHSTTGTRFLCVSTTGVVTASTTACSGT